MIDKIVTLHSNDTWDLVSLPIGNPQLAIIGSTQLKLILMVKLIVLRPAWLLKAILRFMVLTMLTHSNPSKIIVSYSSPRLLCILSLYTRWIFIIPSFMVILTRKFIWSNHLDCCSGTV